MMNEMPEYKELMSLLETTKKEISKLQENVQASIDLSTLDDKNLIKKIHSRIDNHIDDEVRSQYVCCIFSSMVNNSNLNWQIYFKQKLGENCISSEEFNILGGIDTGRSVFLQENIHDKKFKSTLKSLVEKSVKLYKKSIF